MTRFGLHRLVAHYARSASKSTPSLSVKRVSPHIIRHTTAVHLLRSGVDINTIRAWLGHVSLDTTHVYAEVDMEMKATALASVDIKGLVQIVVATRGSAISESVSAFTHATLSTPLHGSDWASIPWRDVVPP